MTPDLSSTAPVRTRRNDRLAAHSLDHFSLAVPDLEAARAFYTAFGLDVRSSARGLELRAVDDEHVWAIVKAGDAKRLDYLSFGVFAEELAAFSRKLAGAGVATEPSPSGVASNGLWFRDPHGVLIELRVASKVTPDTKAHRLATAALSGFRGAPMRDAVDRVRPLRMSHALFFTPDIDRSIAFYGDVLGVRLSDHPGPVAFLHGGHGSDHHMIAFATSSKGPGFHHSAWDVDSIEAIGRGAQQMNTAGYDRGWGLGRHALGSNYFHYVRDPWGSYAEYSYDIDHVPADMEWEATRGGEENSLYLWGPNVPDDFVVNYEGVTTA